MERNKGGYVIQTPWNLEGQRLFDSGLCVTQHPRLIHRQKGDPCPQIPNLP